MRKRLILPVTAIILSLALSANADNKQVVTVGQQQLTETVTKLTFDGDNVTLHMENGQTQTVDMADVVVTFTVVDALKAIEKEAENAPLAYFDLSGKQLKTAPKKGPFIMQKGKKVVKIMKQD